MYFWGFCCAVHIVWMSAVSKSPWQFHTQSHGQVGFNNHQYLLAMKDHHREEENEHIDTGLWIWLIYGSLKHFPTTPDEHVAKAWMFLWGQNVP